MREAVVVSYARTGLAKSARGGFNMTPAMSMAAHAIEHAVVLARLVLGGVWLVAGLMKVVSSVFGTTPFPTLNTLSLYQALQKVKEGRYQKKAVLLVTDGEDTTSLTRFDKALQNIREAEMLVYSVGIKGAPGFDLGADPVSGSSGSRLASGGRSRG